MQVTFSVPSWGKVIKRNAIDQLYFKLVSARIYFICSLNSRKQYNIQQDRRGTYNVTLWRVWLVFKIPRLS